MDLGPILWLHMMLQRAHSASALEYYIVLTRVIYGASEGQCLGLPL